jgi:hypothetical protein
MHGGAGNAPEVSGKVTQETIVSVKTLSAARNATEMGNERRTNGAEVADRWHTRLKARQLALAERRERDRKKQGEVSKGARAMAKKGCKAGRSTKYNSRL